jgi:hypothetical protein
MSFDLNYLSPEEKRRRMQTELPVDAAGNQSYYDSGGDVVTAAQMGASAGGAPGGAAGGAAGGAGAAAAGGAGAMPWVNAIAGALAQRQQEQDAKRQARADLAAQYAGSQGDFPMYGAQATQKRRAIDNKMGGPGLGTLRRLGRGLGSKFG